MTEQAEPEIRYLGDMQRLRLEPGDIIVLMVPATIKLSSHAIERLNEAAKDAFGGQHKVVVLEEGIRVGVMGPGDGVSHGEPGE